MSGKYVVSAEVTGHCQKNDANLDCVLVKKTTPFSTVPWLWKAKENRIELVTRSMVLQKEVLTPAPAHFSRTTEATQGCPKEGLPTHHQERRQQNHRGGRCGTRWHHQILELKETPQHHGKVRNQDKSRTASGWGHARPASVNGGGKLHFHY